MKLIFIFFIACNLVAGHQFRIFHPQLEEHWGFRSCWGQTLNLQWSNTKSAFFGEGCPVLPKEYGKALSNTTWLGPIQYPYLGMLIASRLVKVCYLVLLAARGGLGLMKSLSLYRAHPCRLSLQRSSFLRETFSVLNKMHMGRGERCLPWQYLRPRVSPGVRPGVPPEIAGEN